MLLILAKACRLTKIHSWFRGSTPLSSRRGGKIVGEEVLHSVNSLKMCSFVLIGSKHLSSFYFFVKVHLSVSLKDHLFEKCFL